MKRIVKMRRWALLPVATAVVVLAMVMVQRLANADESEFRLHHLSADPFATSREEAMRKREEAFRALGFTPRVIAGLLRVTSRPGESVMVSVGHHFEAIVLKGGVVRHDVIVAFKAPTSAEKWQIQLDGVILEVFLPEGYFSWSIKLSTSGKSIMARSTSVGRTHSTVARAAL